ncbi:tRNA (N6-isopentenyl adenosine(37)-C2)-methylthiotransferase MiaB [candidate division WOR-3 bacterium]|nr:tRNA (N6-isopentenyl adenosine(37)-C2)-methylthiotransferase MiaB [candidate division WOR-3 bacterium]
MRRGKLVYIITYGCQMNVYDSGVVGEILGREGYKEVNEINKADVILVNTCSVREHAERRALGRISELQGLKKENPGLLIGVIGCMAQNLGNSIKGADFVVGPLGYRKLPEIIDTGYRIQDTRYKIQDTKLVCIEESLELYSDIFPKPDEGVSAFVPVMRGCDNFCTYCIVPYVRGRARSRPHLDILREIELLLDKGIKEITLLGQSVNEYYDGEVGLAGLLGIIDKTGLPRLKFLTSHPKNLTRELIEVMENSKSICKYLHLPLQSGSTRVLNKMGRGYTREEYIDWIYKLREAMQDISITTDIMVGFPGETGKDFNETLDLVKTTRFDFAYMFKYSDRKGTKAQGMSLKVNEEVKKERLKELIEVQNKITREKHKELVGKTVEILVEGRSRRGNNLYGRTSQNKVIVFSDKARAGDFIKVKVMELRGWTPYGKIQCKMQN